MNARHEDFTNYRRRDWRRTEPHDGNTCGRFRAYLRSLSAEHWMLFGAGLVIGLILG